MHQHDLHSCFKVCNYAAGNSSRPFSDSYHGPLNACDGVRRVTGLHRDLAVSAEDPTDPHIPLSKNRLRPSRCEFCAGSKHIWSYKLPTQNSQQEGRSQWDMCIGVGSSAETARSLRNPETRRTPSYDIIRQSSFREFMTHSSWLSVRRNKEHVTLTNFFVKFLSMRIKNGASIWVCLFTKFRHVNEISYRDMLFKKSTQKQKNTNG